MTNNNKRFKVNSKYEKNLKSCDKMQLYFDTKVSESVPFIQYASFCSTLTVHKISETNVSSSRLQFGANIWAKVMKFIPAFRETQP